MSLEPVYGRSVAGFTVGVLHINSQYALVPGNVQHAATFPFPILYEEIELTSMEDLFAGAPYIEDLLIAGAERLMSKGVGAIVGACGSFGYYQKAVAARASVPTYLSIMTQVPFLLQGLGEAKLGVICASNTSMNARMYDQCGIADPTRLVIAQMKGRPAFNTFLAGESVDMTALRAETLEAAQDILQSSPDVQAVLLQCSDLPPFGRDIQASTALPVFDASLLISWLHLANDRMRYSNR